MDGKKYIQVLERSPNNKPLNNLSYGEDDYCPYKNYQSFAHNRNVIYYMSVHNERKKTPETIASLWRFDMEKGENGEESLVCDFDAHQPSAGALPNSTPTDQKKYRSMYCT
jgi:hypothetical protein